MLKTLPQEIDYNNINEYEPEHQEVCIVSNITKNVYQLVFYNKEAKHWINEYGILEIKVFPFWINMSINSK